MNLLVFASRGQDGSIGTEGKSSITPIFGGNLPGINDFLFHQIPNANRIIASNRSEESPFGVKRNRTDNGLLSVIESHHFLTRSDVPDTDRSIPRSRSDLFSIRGTSDTIDVTGVSATNSTFLRQSGIPGP